jgi:gliding motility-associated-like protein
VAVNTKPGDPLQGCRYATTVPIGRTEHKPEINATLTGITANMNCDASIANGTGVITIALKQDGVDADPANFTFVWTNKDDNSPVPASKKFGVNNKDLRNMVDNELGYEVVFTTTTELNKGCSGRATFLIPAIEQDLRLADGDFKTKAITQCIPGSPTSEIMTNGSAEFVAIQKDGVDVAAPFAGFTFSWLDRATNTELPSVTNPIANLDSGKYTAIAKYTDTGCDVSFDFIIQDSTLGSVGMDLIAFGREIMCVDPIPGFLEVKATSETETGQDYEFTWFGYDNMGVRTLVRGPILAASDMLSNQPSVTDFTVRVLNPRNNCWIEDTHTIELEAIEFSVWPNSTPITQCPNPFLGIVENGATFASVTRADGLPVSQDNFDFHWYDENDNPIDVAPSLENLSSAYLGRDIKVIAFDKMDNRAACQSAPAIVRLSKTLLPVPISLAVLAPVSNCDEDIPNGMASANVDGDIVNYLFSWFDEDGAAMLPLDPANAFRTDFMADSLKRADYVYTVLATDLISGCISDTTLMIPYEPLPVPMPMIEIISQVTSCIENNGALSASVGGNTQDYIFRWYDNTVTKPNTEAVSPDAYTFYRDTLAAQIPYGVVAVDRATKCESDLVYEILQFTPTYPHFDLEVTPASCGHPDGTVSLILTNNVDIGEIIWDVNPGTISGDPKLGGLVSSKPGEIYTVTVVTLMGCAADTTFLIGSEIHPFNGISRNGDDKNNYFHIDCIEEFQSNVVRIFNRAGTLVYQAEGYDNNTVLFDGLSNRGISPMGNNLPDGTYFYVIDKRNGSKPLAGYLEIVN